MVPHTKARQQLTVYIIPASRMESAICIFVTSASRSHISCCPEEVDSRRTESSDVFLQRHEHERILRSSGLRNDGETASLELCCLDVDICEVGCGHADSCRHSHQDGCRCAIQHDDSHHGAGRRASQRRTGGAEEMVWWQKMMKDHTRGRCARYHRAPQVGDQCKEAASRRTMKVKQIRDAALRMYRTAICAQAGKRARQPASKSEIESRRRTHQCQVVRP